MSDTCWRLQPHEPHVLNGAPCAGVTGPDLVAELTEIIDNASAYSVRGSGVIVSRNQAAAEAILRAGWHR